MAGRSAATAAHNSSICDRRELDARLTAGPVTIGNLVIFPVATRVTASNMKTVLRTEETPSRSGRGPLGPRPPSPKWLLRCHGFAATLFYRITISTSPYSQTR